MKTWKKTFHWHTFFYTNAVLLSLAGLKVLIHCWINLHDTFFRDELYYIACGKHLDFGYVDHPPFIALAAWIVRLMLGDSLFALRLAPALTGGLLVFLTGILVRRLGGGRFAETLAALCVLIAPIYLGLHSFFSMNPFDQLFWLLGALLLIAVIKQKDPRIWILYGLVMGIGLMNKISILFFGFGVFMGILLTPNRRWLFDRWIWIGAGITFIIFLPHVLWQAFNGWPTREFIQNATANKNVAFTPAQYFLAQIIQCHPILFPIWLTGLGWYLFSKSGKPFRCFGWMYLTVLVLLTLNRAKPYYLAPAYTILFAGGAIAIESGIQRMRWNWLKPAICIILIAGGAIAAPMALPILPPEMYIRYSTLIGIEASSGERHEMGKLPQHFADRYGWPEMAGTVGEVYQTLSSKEQNQCAIIAGNYGEAGAIDYFGAQYNLPNAISGHNSYYLWGPGERTIEVLIGIGGSKSNYEKFFEEVEQAAMIIHPYAMPYESNLPVFFCRKPKVPIQEIWPRVKNYN